MHSTPSATPECPICLGIRSMVGPEPYLSSAPLAYSPGHRAPLWHIVYHPQLPPDAPNGPREATWGIIGPGVEIGGGYASPVEAMQVISDNHNAFEVHVTGPVNP
jgi:hypothetical protein